MNRNRDALCFRVVLRDIEPAIWRLIWVPARYSFWDLHVAIQDAMGWLDYHLHEFQVPAGIGDEYVRFGIPDDDAWGDSPETLPGWDYHLAHYVSEPKMVVRYVYDFGDGWIHDLTLEKIAPREKGVRYPRCVGGARACPPEDCGGPSGFFELVQALRDPMHPQHSELTQWIPRGWTADRFEMEQVRFTNPTWRWRRAFGD